MPAIKSSTLSFMDVIRFAATYWMRQPVKLFIILTITFFASLVETYLPSALANFLTQIQLHHSKHDILFYLEIFLLVYLAQTILYAIIYLLYNVFETSLFKNLVDDAFKHVYRLSDNFFANTFTGSIVSKIYRARTKFEVFEDQIFFRIYSTLIILIGSIGFLALRFPMLALMLTLYLVFLIAVSAFLVFKVSGPPQGIYADAQDHFNSQLADNIGGMATTKAYANEAIEIKNLQNISEDLRKKNLRAYLLGNSSGIIQRILLTGMLALLMLGGTWYFFEGKASIASMAYLAFAYTILQSYIRDVVENIKNLLTSSYDLHAVIALMNETPEVTTEIALPDLVVAKGEVEFENVTFTYPNKQTPIFKNFSVTIKAGERVALVGHSGGGKTSFIRLLQHLYPIQNGSIKVDGQDIQKFSQKSLRSIIATVPQEPILFHRSIRDNIAYAKPESSLSEIMSAAEKAHIHDFIITLPEQYDTLVGERGVKLSGGERQRIAIARAILANRPILILDEATSSLDSESERVIQEALHELICDRTSIIIAHRLSTILDADRILVFANGEIVEAGRHETLVAKPNGVYANLFKLQSGSFI